MKKLTRRPLWAALVLTIYGLAHPVLADTGPARPKFKKVFVVVFENMDYETAIRQPFFYTFAARGALMTNFHAEGRPSQPNYLAMISGSMHGVATNDNVDLDVRHLGDLLEAKGLTWKNYAEGYPGNCYLKPTRGPYSRKHVPFLSFTNVTRDPNRCANVVSSEQLAIDVKNGALPDYALFTPDNNSNGHDTDAAYADKWFEKTFGDLLYNPRFMKDMLFVATFDESSYFGFNRIYTAFYGNRVGIGSVSNTYYDHYSLLRTIEDEFGLGTLGLNDAKAKPITDIWD